MSVELQLFALRAAHTGVFVVEVAAILYMLWRGVRGGFDLWTGAAVLLTAGTGAGLLLNGGDCIFHSWAEGVSGRDGVSDLFLPDAVARLIVPVSTPPTAVAYGLLAWRWRQRRSRAA